jgi:hypothetical protein
MAKRCESGKTVGAVAREARFDRDGAAQLVYGKLRSMPEARRRARSRPRSQARAAGGKTGPCGWSPTF